MKMITGSAGFIGSHFAKQYEQYLGVEQHNAIHILERFTRWQDIDEIIHMGAISSTTETDLNKLHFYNVELTLKLFEKAIEYQIPVRYASSASVYGTFINGTINPLNYYAMTKAQVDYWVQDNIDRFHKIQGFRFFNVYGDGEEHKGNQRSPISKFTEEAKMTGKIKIFEGSENMLRDFIFVDDIVRIVPNNREGSGIFDLGSTYTYSFRDIAEIIAKKYGAEIIEIPFPEHLKGKYQYFTKSNHDWYGYRFTKVEEYINRPLQPDTNQTHSES
tara:strand:- start:173 stop:994 length:822 start_codon:yes stop_codon:yes gene_type:complete